MHGTQASTLDAGRHLRMVRGRPYVDPVEPLANLPPVIALLEAAASLGPGRTTANKVGASRDVAYAGHPGRAPDQGADRAAA